MKDMKRSNAKNFLMLQKNLLTLFWNQEALYSNSFVILGGYVPVAFTVENLKHI